MASRRAPTVDQVACGGSPWTWLATDGTPFPGLAWEPNGQAPIANVLCIHGLSGSAADFGPVARALTNRGCRVWAINVRGQGNDPDAKRRGHFLDPKIWRADLAACAEAIGNDLPFYVIGESMGSLISVDAVAHGALVPERLVLSVPVPEIRTPIPKWVIFLMHHIAEIFPRAHLSPLRFVNKSSAMPRLTADDDYMEYLRTAPHRVTDFTIGFLSNFQRFMLGCQSCAAQIKIPTLMLSGGKDIFISEKQSRKFFESIGAAKKEFLFLPESHHLLWHDIDKDDVLDKISSWIICPPSP